MRRPASPFSKEDKTDQRHTIISKAFMLKKVADWWVTGGPCGIVAQGSLPFSPWLGEKRSSLRAEPLDSVKGISRI
jgi:hypothetical protein